MATSSYYKAMEWVKKVNLAKIESLRWLENCTIRQLRAIADKINHQDKGWVFCTATLGKALSRHTKQELAETIWNFLSLKRSAPKTSKWFECDETGNLRIVTQRPGTHDFVWTVSIGYNTYKDAEVLQKYLHKNGHCSASVIRSAKHCSDFKYELKVWLLDNNILKALIAKELGRIAKERKQVVASWYEELKLASEENSLAIGKPDFLMQNARLYQGNNMVGSVGLGMLGYWYNTRPNSAVSQNIPAVSISDAVEKLVKVHQKIR